MRVWDGLGEVPEDLDGSVVTIGMFAGRHRGHRAVIETTVAKARELGVPAIAMTFTPHPLEVHHPERKLAHLESTGQRTAALAASGVDAVLLISYTLGFAANSPEDFVRTYVVDGLRAKAVVIGEDARFGAGNSGTAATMRELGERYGFSTTVLTDLCDPVSGRRWSSTWVREALAEGDVTQAEYVLGRPHAVRGEVVHGAKRGRELGYPTANLEIDDVGVIPADGVYAGWLVDGEARYPAAVSVGTNPHFDGVHRTVEAHVLGRRDLNFYGRVVTVEFIRWIRGMERFDSLDALLARMARDVEETADVLGVERPGPAVPGVIGPAANLQ